MLPYGQIWLNIIQKMNEDSKANVGNEHKQSNIGKQWAIKRFLSMKHLNGVYEG